MNQPVWNMTDDDGDVMAAVAAEARMCVVVSDRQLAEQYLDEIARVDKGLRVLALIVNPELRVKLWDTLDDETKFYVLVYEKTGQDRAALIHRVVHDVMSLYHDPMEGVEMP